MYLKLIKSCLFRLMLNAFTLVQTELIYLLLGQKVRKVFKASGDLWDQKVDADKPDNEDYLDKRVVLDLQELRK